MSSKIEAFFRVILEEVKKNPRFRDELTRALTDESEVRQQLDSGRGKARNRRTAAVLDPYEAIKQGEDALRRMLEELTVEQLKDVVSQFAVDPSKLALKWKSKEKLVDLILQTTKGRLEKGDAFRS